MGASRADRARPPRDTGPACRRGTTGLLRRHRCVLPPSGSARARSGHRRGGALDRAGRAAGRYRHPGVRRPHPARPGPRDDARLDRGSAGTAGRGGAAAGRRGLDRVARRLRARAGHAQRARSSGGGPGGRPLGSRQRLRDRRGARRTAWPFSGTASDMCTSRTSHARRGRRGAAGCRAFPARASSRPGRVLDLLRARGYDRWVSFEWEKRWHPALEEPEVALPLLRALGGTRSCAAGRSIRTGPTARTLSRGRLEIEVHPDRPRVGAAAAAVVSAELRRQVEREGRAAAIFASAPSQNELLAVLREDASIPWERITAFHLDEYVGVDASHPASFRRFLVDRLFAHVPVRAFHGLAGEAKDAVRRMRALRRPAARRAAHARHPRHRRERPSRLHRSADVRLLRARGRARGGAGRAVPAPAGPRRVVRGPRGRAPHRALAHGPVPCCACRGRWPSCPDPPNGPRSRPPSTGRSPAPARRRC